MSDTGFPKGVRATIDSRSGGICEVQTAACIGHASQRHHRRPRGSGGTSQAWVNRAGNGLAVCEVCHRWIESNRAAATEFGWLVPMNQAWKSVEVPVLYRHQLVLLDDFGGVLTQGVPF